MTRIKKKTIDRCAAVILSLTMMIVFPIVSFADVFAGTADAANTTQTVQTEESAAAEGESVGTDQDQAAEPADPADSEEAAETDTDSGESDADVAASEDDSSASEDESSAANESGDASGNEGSEVSYPRQTFDDSVNGTNINVVAPEGALPEGTKMEVSAVASSDVKGAVEKATSGDIQDMQAIDISFHKDGKEIEPEAEVTVQFSGMDMDGDGIQVFHMDNVSSDADQVAESASTTNASVDSDQFSIYVLVGIFQIPVTAADPHKAYTMKTGTTETLHESPGIHCGTWKSSDSSIVSVKDTTNGNTASAVITANKAGKAVITYTYYVKTLCHVCKVTHHFYVNVYAPYKATYSFISGTPNMTAPKELDAYLPNDSREFRNGDYVKPLAPIKTTYDVVDNGVVTGTWTFQSWDKNCKQIKCGNACFQGKWTYEAAQGYGVTYKYEKAKDETRDLPGAISDTATPGNYAVSDSNTYLAGKTVQRNSPLMSTYEERDGTALIGTWTLSWPADSAVMVKGGLTFTGCWSFTEAGTVIAEYKFEPAADAALQVLPEGVTKQCPETTTGLTNGQVVTPSTEFSDVDQMDTNGNKIGTWKFTEWDKKTATVESTNLTFTGYWSYTAVTPFHVSYKFVPEDGSLPKEAIDQLPVDNMDYYVNNTVTPPDVTNFAKVPVFEFDGSFGYMVGYWELTKWKPSATQTFTNGNIEFVGTWEYKKAEIPFEVEYRDINDPNGDVIANGELGMGYDKDVVDHDYLNAKGLIKGITNYTFVRVDPITLYIHKMAAPASRVSTFATDEGEAPQVVTVWYEKIVTPPPSIDKYTLSINYVDEQGNKLAESYTGLIEPGTTYSQDSPVITDYSLKDSAQATVAGTMPKDNVTIDVVYIKTAVTPNDPNEPNDQAETTTPVTVKPASDKSAETGDSWNGGLWMILLLLGTAGVIAPITLKRKD